MVPEPTRSEESPAASSETTTFTDWLVIFGKGLAMGAADAVPGVSGGTIALITGIYERLIRAVTQLDPSVLRCLPRIHRREARRECADTISEMDLPFLVVLGTGMVSAVVVLARVVQLALTYARGPTFAFFFGLIGASAIVLGRREWLLLPSHLVVIFVGGGLAYWIAGASGYGLVPHTVPVVFLAGMVAISGMVLPGISGAFILLLLGQYDPMTAALNGFVDGILALWTAGLTPEFLRDSVTVATFLTGAVIGLVTVAYVVRLALEAYRSLTLAFLVSLMVGALRLPIIEIADDVDATFTPTIASVFLAAFLGVAAVLLLDYSTDDLTY